MIINTKLEKRNVKKLGVFYRSLAFFLVIISLPSLLILPFVAFEGGFAFYKLAIFLAPLLILYVSVPVLLTGYPPKMLLWTSDKP